MNKTNKIKNIIFIMPVLMAGLVFSAHVEATEAIQQGIFALYPNAIHKGTGNAIECQHCHVGEYPGLPNPPIGLNTDVTLLPNVLDAYNADKTTYTGSVNLLAGCPAGTTANATQPWVCEGGAPNPNPMPTPTPTPTPVPAPAPTPALPIACDDAANTPSCQKQANQYGTIGTADSSAGMADVYQVRCGRNTKALKVSVSDLAPDNPNAVVSIQAFKGKSKSRISTDSADGDNGYSPVVRLAKGSGQYLVRVVKSNSDMAGAELYDAQIQCVGGKQAQTTIKIKENQ